MIARLIDLLEVLLATVRQAGFPPGNETRESLDRVHRGAQLVGHRREEGGFAFRLRLDLADVEVATVAERDGLCELPKCLDLFVRERLTRV